MKLNNTQTILSINNELLNISSTSKRENNLLKKIQSLFDAKIYESKFDNLGSLIITKKSSKPNHERKMLAIEVDNLGFQVKEISDNGFIKFSKFDKFWEHFLLGQKVKIVTKKGNIYDAIIGSIAVHSLTIAEEEMIQTFNSLFIDLGAKTKLEVEKMGIEVGDEIYFDQTFELLPNKKILTSKPNYLLHAGLIDMYLNQLNWDLLDFELYLVFYYQHRNIYNGLVSSTYSIKPTSFINFDLINENPLNHTSVGKGPFISIYDASNFGDVNQIQKLRKTSSKLKLKLQFEVTRKTKSGSGVIALSHEGALGFKTGIVKRQYGKSSIVSVEDVNDLFILIKNFLERDIH